MATTIYSPTVTAEGISYRVKVDYNVSESATSKTISGTMQMQYKGTYKASAYIGGAYGRAVVDVGAGGGYVYQPAASVSYSANISSGSKSSWTNTGSAKSFSGTVQKEIYAQTMHVAALITQYTFIEPGDEDENCKYVNVALPALQSWDITYHRNDGTSNTIVDKKYYNRTATLRNALSREGYSQLKWNTKADGTGTSYAFGAPYASNAALTLYAIWSNTVSYNGNGIELSKTQFPNQAKLPNTNLVLHSAVPQRAGYEFVAWNTNANGTGTRYDPGDTYTSDAPLTLYAQWLSLPQNPQITSMTAIRCKADGTPDNIGTYALVTVNWSVDTTSGKYPGNTGTVTGKIIEEDGTESSFSFDSGASGTSGTATAIVSNLSIFSKYIIQATVTDVMNSTFKNVILSGSYTTLDWLRGGRGISFGTPMEASDLYEPVTGLSAPTFTANKYYEMTMSGSVMVFTLLESQPSDWSTNWGNYYTKVHDSLFRCAMDSEFQSPVQFGSSLNSSDCAYKEFFVGDVTAACKLKDTSLSSTSTDHNWITAAIKVICEAYPNQKASIFKGRISPNSHGYFEIFIYDTSDTDASTGIPRYGYGEWHKWTTNSNIAGGNTSICSYFVINAYAVSSTSGPLIQNGTGSTDTYVGVMRSDTGCLCNFGIGTGGYNHGVYSPGLSAWMIYACIAAQSGVGHNIARVYRTPTITTIASVIAVNSSVATISSVQYTERAGIAQIYIAWTNKNAISVPASGNISNVTVGTLVAGKRPAINSSARSAGDNAGAAWYNIGTGGAIGLGACEGTGSARTIAAGTTFQIYATYILA